LELTRTPRDRDAATLCSRDRARVRGLSDVPVTRPGTVDSNGSGEILASNQIAHDGLGRRRAAYVSEAYEANADHAFSRNTNDPHGHRSRRDAPFSRRYDKNDTPTQFFNTFEGDAAPCAPCLEGLRPPISEPAVCVDDFDRGVLVE
jgi:hypothetical protein